MLKVWKFESSLIFVWLKSSPKTFAWSKSYGMVNKGGNDLLQWGVDLWQKIDLCYDDRWRYVKYIVMFLKKEENDDVFKFLVELNKDFNEEVEHMKRYHCNSFKTFFRIKKREGMNVVVSI